MTDEVSAQPGVDPDVEGQALWDEIAAEDGKPAPETPPEAATEEVTPAPAAEPAEAAAPPQVDPVALQKKIDELTGLVKSSVGRVAALQSALDKREAAASAPTHTQVANAAKSTEKWKQLKADFPEWAEAVEEFVSANAAPAVNADEIVAKATASVGSVVTEAHMNTAKQLAAFAEPDWESVVQSAAFGDWIGKQPADYVAAAAEASEKWDALKVVSIVRDFKKATTKTSPTVTRGSAPSSQARLASAAVPSGSAATRKSTEELEGEDYWRQLAREERQNAA